MAEKCNLLDKPAKSFRAGNGSCLASRSLKSGRQPEEQFHIAMSRQ
jgi:hypothetical protein